MRRDRRFGAGVVLLFALTSSATAAAADDATKPDTTKPAGDTKPSADAVKEAKGHYERGTGLYNDLDFKLALIEFRRAYELAPNYKILFNIGQVNLQLNNYADALAALEKYLEQGGAEIPKKRRAEVEKDIAGLKARTAHLTVTTPVEGAMVSVDDGPPVAAPVTSMLIDAGQHRIVVMKEGYVTATKTVTLAPSDEAQEAIELSPVPVAPPPQIVERREYLPPPPTEPPPPPPSPSYVWVGWAATGLLVAGAATTGGLALTAKSSLDDKRTGGVTTSTDLQSAHDKARTLGYVTDALVGAAVVVAGVSLYFTLKKPSSAKKTGDRGGIQVGVGPGAVRVAASF